MQHADPSNPPLPNDWVEKFDPRTGTKYYVDHLLKTTQWERPKPLPQKWTRKLDPTSKRIYYVDHNTRTTHWNVPEVHNIPSSVPLIPTAPSLQTVRSTDSRSNSPLIRNLENLDIGINPSSGASSRANSSYNLAASGFEAEENQVKPQKTSNLVYRQISSGDDSELLNKKKMFENENDNENENEDLQMELTEFPVEKLEEYLGPLPDKWQSKTTKQNQQYFVNHTAKVSQWEDPRILGWCIRESIPPNWEEFYIANDKRVYYKHKFGLRDPTFDPWKIEGLNRKELGMVYYKDFKKTFKERYTYLRKLCDHNKPDGYVKIKLYRNNLFDSAYEFFMDDILRPHDTSRFKTPNELRGRLYIQYPGEDGLDYGGLSREFFLLISKFMGNPDYGYFLQTQNYSLHVNPLSELTVGEDHLKRYQFIGRLVGMALYHQRHLDMGLSLPFYKRLLGKPIKLSDIADVDEDFYQNLKFLLDNEIDELYMCLDFTMNDSDRHVLF